jgi:hypothetical protein
LRLLERCLRTVNDRLDALHVGFDLPAIEREQQLALFDMGAVAEMDARDCGIDLRLDGDTGDRGHTAERTDAHRHGFAHSGRDFDRNGPHLALRPGGCPVTGPQPAREHGNADQGKRRPTNKPFWLDHRQFSVRTHVRMPGRSLIRGMA